MKKRLMALVFVMLATVLLHALSLAQTEGRKIRLVTKEISLGITGIITGIIEESLIVSPDSKRVAYVAERGDKVLVVVDGVEGEGYNRIYSLLFSPDSKRVAYGARRGDKWLAVVDGVEGKKYDGFLRGSRLVFDSPKLLHTLARRDDEIFRVEIEIVEE